jgi:iron complex outermembrane receptor protein
VGALPKSQVPAYTALDARLGWAPVPALELSLLLENLGADRHAEWGAAPGRSAYPRRLAARLAWRF